MDENITRRTRELERHWKKLSALREATRVAGQPQLEAEIVLLLGDLELEIQEQIRFGRRCADKIEAAGYRVKNTAAA